MSQDQLKTPAADEPITLAGACQLFPRAKLTVSTLRAEAARGRLEIFRLGRRDYTTPAAMERMVQRCRESRRVSISTPPEGNESVYSRGISSRDYLLNV